MEHKTVPSEYEETIVPGGGVDWCAKGKVVKQYRFPTVAFPVPKSRANTTNPSMPKRLLLVEEWLDSTLGLCWKRVAYVMADGAFASQVIEMLNAWTAKFQWIGRGRGT